MHVSSFAYKLAYIVVIQQNTNNVLYNMRCCQRHSQDRLSIYGLPSFCTDCIPLLFPPNDDSCRKAAPSTTRDLGERCKDPQRVLCRAPADNTFWVDASDPILSQLRCGGGSEDPQPQKFFGHYICNFTCFSALLKLIINNDRKI